MQAASANWLVKLLGWQIGPIRSQTSLLDVPNRGQSLQTIHRLGKQEIRAVTVVYQVVLCGCHWTRYQCSNSCCTFSFCYELANQGVLAIYKLP